MIAISVFLKFVATASGACKPTTSKMATRQDAIFPPINIIIQFQQLGLIQPVIIGKLEVEIL